MAKADAAVMEQLAPTGKLRVAVAVSPSPSAQFAIKDGDTYRGVAVILGTALAEKMGVPVEILPHQASGEIQDSAASGRWDVAFLPVDDERKKFVDFGNAYHLLQSTFLAAPGSRIMSVSDADTAGTALAYVSEFIEEAKESGLVRRAFDEMGLRTSIVAPAGMKP